jgi:predicted TIM-barrel fold metal-dependent hydrolase
MIDGLQLLGDNRFGPTLTVDQALASADGLGIERIVAAPARPSGYHLGPANDALAAAAERSGGRITSLARVDPLEGDRAVEEARRCHAELGVTGFFLHPGEEAFPVRLARPLVEAVRDLGSPIVIASGFFSLSEPLQVAELAAAVPEIPVVLTTGGQINISGLSMVDAWLALSSTPNLHVMTNGEYRQDFIERLADELDPRRVLFASFAPVFDPAFEVDRIRSARLSDVARRAIEHENAERLFGR